MVDPLREFQTRMPVTAEVVGPRFAAHLSEIGELDPSDWAAGEQLVESLKAKPELVCVFVAALIWPAGGATCSQLESDLSLLQTRTAREKVKSAFGAKLATSLQVDDVLFEIAVCAAASGWFDTGTLDFETPKTGSSKNTDATGMRGGRQARIEIKLVHDSLAVPSDAGVRTRSTVDPHDWAELSDANRANVFTSQDLKRDPQTHKNTPLSTVLWQKLDEKRAQCEPGSLNVVALGLKPRLSGRDVDEALRGVTVPVLFLHGRPPALVGRANGPFVEQTGGSAPGSAAPFAIFSAVWELGISGQTASIIHPNPNATVPGTETDWADLAAVGRQRFVANRMA